MRARDLAMAAPVLGPADTAAYALHVLVTAGLPGVVVHDGSSYVVIPASQVLRVALPRYVLDDPSLGRVWDEASADALHERLADRHVSDLVAALQIDDAVPEPTVDGAATVVEIAAVMAAAHVPLVAVADGGAFLGVVTVDALVRRLLA